LSNLSFIVLKSKVSKYEPRSTPVESVIPDGYGMDPRVLTPPDIPAAMPQDAVNRGF